MAGKKTTIIASSATGGLEPVEVVVKNAPKAEAKSQKTKRIYCKATFCGSWGNYEGGRTYDVDAALADEFIKTGFAKEVKGGE